MPGYDHRQRKTTFSPAPSSGPPGRNYGGGNNNNNNNNNNIPRRTIIDNKANEDTSGPNQISNSDMAAIQAARKANEDKAYEQSKIKQKAMQNAINLAYRNGNPSSDGANDNSQLSLIDSSQSNFQNLDNDQLQYLIDSGFAASESSGVLGGTFGAEIEMNRLKSQLQYDQEGKLINNEAVKALDRLNAGIGGYKATDMQDNMGLLSFDPSAVYSFGSDVDRFEGGTYLKDAFYDMQSPNLTTKNYKNYMNHIDAFGHNNSYGYGGGYGGGGGGYGGGGGGDSSSGGSPRRGGMPQGNPNERFGGMAALQQNMINTNAGENFMQGYARGGLVSLVC